MTAAERVQAHYANNSIIDSVVAALAKIGKSPRTITVEDVSLVDEFHIGGRAATLHLLDQLDLKAGDPVLDLGCGIGGAARGLANRKGCKVTGIDLTADYVEAARTLTDWFDLSDRATFDQGSAIDLPYEDGSYKAAYMLHVGMNIADKAALAREVARVLAPGSAFGIYDVMLTGEPDLVFPVPWAETAETSAVAPLEDYKAALTEAGFEIVAEHNRRDFALDFYRQVRERARAAGGPPALGLHILMGPDAGTKTANMIANIRAGRIAPVELVARLA